MWCMFKENTFPLLNVVLRVLKLILLHVTMWTLYNLVMGVKINRTVQIYLYGPKLSRRIMIKVLITNMPIFQVLWFIFLQGQIWGFLFWLTFLFCLYFSIDAVKMSGYNGYHTKYWCLLLPQIRFLYQVAPISHVRWIIFSSYFSRDFKN